MESMAGSPSTHHHRHVVGRLRMVGRVVLVASVLVAASLVVGVPSADALPTGFTPVFGTVTAVPDGTTYRITQTSASAIVNFSTFSISAGETVTVAQPDADSILLLRVIGGDASTLAGRLESNGTVVLVNPNDVLFASGSAAEVGGLIASTSAISNTDFIAGDLDFVSSDVGGYVRLLMGSSVVVDEGGAAAFIGDQVTNGGSIEAPAGLVALAAGSPATVAQPGSGLPGGVVLGGGIAGAGVSNSAGKLSADGGTIQLLARGAEGSSSGTIVHTGSSRARTSSAGTGSITLDGDGDVLASSPGTTLDVTGDDPGEEGGDIAIHGNRIRLVGERAAPTRIDASGQAGGGRITVSSDDDTVVASVGTNELASSGISITADAQSTGTAGTVSLTSDGNAVIVGNALLSASGLAPAAAAGSVSVDSVGGPIVLVPEVDGAPVGVAAIVADAGRGGARSEVGEIVPGPEEVPILARSFAVDSTGSEAGLPIESNARAALVMLAAGLVTFDDGNVECHAGTGGLVGSTTLAGLASTTNPAVAGLDLSVPDVEATIPGLGRVVFNEQITGIGPAGEQLLTVNGAHVYAENPDEDMVLLQASCAMAGRPPVAVGDEVTTAQDLAVAFDALANDSDPDGGTLELVANTDPAHGTVVCDPAGACTYTPMPGFVGPDSFDYTVSNGFAEAGATVTITVTAAPPPTTTTTSTTTTTTPGGGGGTGGPTDGASGGGTGAGGSGGVLPRTGLPVFTALGLVAVLLAAGTGLHLVGRRRSQA